MSEIFEKLIRDNDRVISVVGAGGKTSLMFLLAHEFQKRGRKVISTTTTRILRPAPHQTGGLFLYEHEHFKHGLYDCLNQHGHATVAQKLIPPANKKLQGITCELVETIVNNSPTEKMIIEADGARNLSCKAPGDNEPVVPAITDVFISMIGLDIIGKPLTDEHVFRAELVSKRTSLPMVDAVTPLTVAQLATHPSGLLKGCPKKARSYIFLNKTDIPGSRENVARIIEAAKQQGGRQPDFWISGSVQGNLCSLMA